MPKVEEELRVGTREREAGSIRVRKLVRTDREQVRVPKKRQEVHVERVPVEEDAGIPSPRSSTTATRSGVRWSRKRSLSRGDRW